MATKAKKAKGKAVITATQSERTLAGELLQAGLLLAEIASDYFGMVRDAITSGATFEGMESAEPGLKEIGAYRSAKSVIRNAKAQGKKLFNGDGSPKGKRALSEELAPTNAKGERKGKKRVNSKREKYATKHDVIVAAFALLKAEPTLRKAYRDEIMSTARALANDEAGNAGKVRVSKQRTTLVSAAAKQEKLAA